jgi:hypothetical protein
MPTLISILQTGISLPITFAGTNENFFNITSNRTPMESYQMSYFYWQTERSLL